MDGGTMLAIVAGLVALVVVIALWPKRSRNVYRSGTTVVQLQAGDGSNMSAGVQVNVYGKPVYTDEQLRDQFAALRRYPGVGISTPGVETLKVPAGKVSLHPDDELPRGMVTVEGGRDHSLNNREGTATLKVGQGTPTVHYGPGVTIRY